MPLTGLTPRLWWKPDENNYFYTHRFAVYSFRKILCTLPVSLGMHIGTVPDQTPFLHLNSEFPCIRYPCIHPNTTVVPDINISLFNLMIPCGMFCGLWHDFLIAFSVISFTQVINRSQLKICNSVLLYFTCAGRRNAGPTPVLLTSPLGLSFQNVPCVTLIADDAANCMFRLLRKHSAVR